VISVLQSAGFFFTVVFAAAVAVLLPATVLAPALVEVAGQTPKTVNTTASSGTSAAGAALVGVWAGLGDGAVPGGACPQAIAPNNTHSSQLLRIRKILQDWYIGKLE
jgi:hypothetical protein